MEAVGAALSGSNGSGNKGNDSVISGDIINITSVGGGFGAGVEVSSGGSGGSGGGSLGYYHELSSAGHTTRGSREIGQGYQGGLGLNRDGVQSCTHPNYGGGGGGGAGGQGGDMSNCSTSGVGGAGLSSSITGSAVTRGGGGGGGVRGGISGGSGGSGGGGAGAANEGSAGSNGSPNTGGGGGGSGNDYYSTGSQGGSGIIVIRWSNSVPAAASTTGSPSYSNTGGYHIYTFNGSGSITP